MQSYVSVYQSIKSENFNIEYTMKGSKLENVDSFKDSGVIFDNHLS